MEPVREPDFLVEFQKLRQRVEYLENKLTTFVGAGTAVMNSGQLHFRTWLNLLFIQGYLTDVDQDRPLFTLPRGPDATRVIPVLTSHGTARVTINTSGEASFTDRVSDKAKLDWVAISAVIFRT
jgi:hypothetical protein